MKIEEQQGKLIVVDFNELDSYKIACKIEKDGVWFYNKIMGVVDQPESKEVLGFLIQEEKKHLAFFEECLSHVRQMREDHFEEDDLLSTINFGIFEPYQSIDELENILSDVQKALKLGIIVEEKSIKFYEACRMHVSSKEAKQKIGDIIEEETKHKALLESISSHNQGDRL
jgi:rubrerythrin